MIREKKAKKKTSSADEEQIDHVANILQTHTVATNVHGMKDEDDMASNSDQHTATQQSIKAYVDTTYGAAQHNRQIQPSIVIAEDNFTSGANNVYYIHFQYGVVFGTTSKTHGAMCAVQFKLPDDYVAGQNITCVFDVMARVINEVIDYDITFYYSNAATAVVQISNHNATWTTGGVAFATNEFTLTISGTNLSAGDHIYVKITMEDDNNAQQVYLPSCTLEVPCNTRV